MPDELNSTPTFETRAPDSKEKLNLRIDMTTHFVQIKLTSLQAIKPVNQ